MEMVRPFGPESSLIRFFLLLFPFLVQGRRLLDPTNNPQCICGGMCSEFWKLLESVVLPPTANVDLGNLFNFLKAFIHHNDDNHNI